MYGIRVTRLTITFLAAMGLWILWGFFDYELHEPHLLSGFLSGALFTAVFYELQLVKPSTNSGQAKLQIIDQYLQRLYGSSRVLRIATLAILFCLFSRLPFLTQAVSVGNFMGLFVGGIIFASIVEGASYKRNIHKN